MARRFHAQRQERSPEQLLPAQSRSRPLAASHL